MKKSIVIIGGGLTGLSAGCYGRMNGYETSIFEMHSITGGVATAWKRNGYTIDGAMNWLMGTKPGSGNYQVWEELGVAQNWKIYNHDLNAVIENREGKAFSVYCDAERFEQYLLELAPEDEGVIRELTKVQRSANLDFPVGKPPELNNFFDNIAMMKMLPLGNMMRKWSKVNTREYAQRFRNPYLREVFVLAFGGDIPLIMSLMALAMQHRKLAGYVIGGALALVEPIERRYKALGGELHVHARVEKILVESDKAVGVKLADGTEHRADWVISTADGRTTIFDMLEGKYTDDEIRNRYEHPDLFKPLVYVALGVNRTFDDVPPSIAGTSYPLDKPIVVAGKEEKYLNVRVYNFDPTLSPPGKNIAVVGFETDYDYWKNLREDPERYKAEKERIAGDVIAGLEQRFPGITAQVEMRDVATPITWERYTGNWRGAYQGWVFSAESFTSSMRKTLPGLDNFYMAGQWVNPGGGMPTAAISGNHTIQLICKRDKKPFITTKP
ncbi:MAG: NAD(P)/FAD-dependent oxidoreductase [Coprothermobacter sp.]|nr:NAD(P)/FAD-dependent oxidoreductase [Coprothermobacter sp.]